MGSPSQGLTRPGHFGTMPDNPEIWKAVAMADHFEKIQKLPDPIPGVPNFRRVPGYKVYCCGQPTAAALETTLNKACGEIYPKDKKIIWFNMRQEPTVYINGEPVCARPPNKIGEYAELGNVTATSRPTSARSSTTSTRRLTPCSPTCPRATTRSAPSTGSPPRP